MWSSSPPPLTLPSLLKIVLQILGQLLVREEPPMARSCGPKGSEEPLQGMIPVPSRTSRSAPAPVISPW